MLLQEYVTLTKQTYPPITNPHITEAVNILEKAYKKMPNHYLDKNYFQKRLNLSPYLIDAILLELIKQNYMIEIYTVRCRKCQSIITEGQKKDLSMNSHCDWCYEKVREDNVIIEVSFRYLTPCNLKTKNIT